MMKTYGIDIWGENNFIIDQGRVKVNYKSSPSLLEITKNVRKTNLKGPLILRFPHLIEKQIDTLYSNFRRAIFENDYDGEFQAVFPLKVNQFPEAVDAITELGEKYSYGLEAGSKAELVLAMAKTAIGSPITVNGFKDEEMVTLGFMAAQMGHDITVTIEGLGELEWIIDVAKSCGLRVPKIGIRIRLQSEGSGIWAKSAGIHAKFGLTSTELIEAISMLRENDMLEYFSMIHFHVGSQMQEISTLKRVLREAGNIYAELKKCGASKLKAINIGGGLAVEYSQHNSVRMRNYTLEEFSNSVVYLLREIMNAKGVEHPDIFTESGRFIVASHSVLIAPVLELFSHDYQLKSLKLKDTNPPLIEELKYLNEHLSPRTCIEYMHDALDHMESLLTLFNLGHIDLQDRSNAEILVHQIIKKSLYLSQDNPLPDIEKLQVKLQERYLINTSIFQSIPDYWGLGQQFPIMPLDKLDIPAIRAASIWDITCDSDGEIRYKPETPLYLHDIDLDEEEYFLGFFNVGAYQETLGMNHNLFTHPNECTIIINNDGYEIENFTESDNILNILEDIGYDSSKLLTKLKNKLALSNFMTEEEKSDTLQKLEMYLYQNGYLRTTR